MVIPKPNCTCMSSVYTNIVQFQAPSNVKQLLQTMAGDAVECKIIIDGL